MADYLVQEDGTSKILLEDGTGAILLETSGSGPAPPFISSVTVVHAPALGLVGQQVIVTAPGTYTWACPAGVTTIYVEAIGGGGGGKGTIGNAGGGGGGGGAFAAREAVPVTPGTVYTFVVGAGGGEGLAGGDSTFTGDSSTQVVAKGGSGGTDPSGGAGGAAASSVGDTGHVFSGGNGGNGIDSPSSGGGGGGASGDQNGAGANGSDHAGSTGGAGGTGVSGGGSGGKGGDYNTGNAQAGVVPGGGGGGAGGFAGGASGAGGRVYISTGLHLGFIASRTTVYTPTLPIDAPFIGSVTVVHPPSLPAELSAPFIGSTTVVYPPDVPEVRVPFIPSATHVFGAWSLFDPNRTYSGPGNGGESFLIRLAANGVTETATLAADISATDTALTLTGDGSFPSSEPFVATIDSEVIYLVQVAPGSYRIRGRAVSNTGAAAHTAGATVSWGDSYDLALVASSDIARSFTADVNGTGTDTYPGWLICFDSTQAYLSGSRYPMHVTSLLGVFDSGAGSGGTNRCDAAQPNAIATTAAASDDCPAALANPSRISSDILTGDVALVRYTNPEATVLDIGSRAVAIQSWFGLKRVDATDHDVTFTDPNGIVVDTTGAEGTFTGSVNGEWGEPVPLVTGIAPDASDAAGAPISTPNPEPFTTVTLPGVDRKMTYGSGGGGYDEKGWPICCLAVRQGNRRVPFWQSWDWRDYAYVYTGFGVDDTFAQLLINRNGVVFDSVPSVELPGPQDIDGPDAVWDDATYFVGASWYVAIFSTPYLVFGPSIGGELSPGTGGGGGFAPGVSYPGGIGGGPVFTVPTTTIEGGSGGDISPGTEGQLFQAAAV